MISPNYDPREVGFVRSSVNQEENPRGLMVLATLKFRLQLVMGCTVRNKTSVSLLLHSREFHRQ